MPIEMVKPMIRHSVPAPQHGRECGERIIEGTPISLEVWRGERRLRPSRGAP